MPPTVDTKTCKGVAACVEVCPVNVIEIVDGKAVIARPDDCIECRACEAACPNSAISFP